MSKQELIIVLSIVVLLSVFLVYADPYDWALTSVLTTDDIGTYTAIAVNSTDDIHMVSYNATHLDLEHVWYDSNAETWHTDTIQTYGWSGTDAAIAINSTDDLHVVFHEDWDGSNLTHAWYDYGAHGWHTDTIDGDNGVTEIGHYADMAINSTDDIHVSYQNNTNTELLHAWYDSAAGTWHTETVDDGEGGLKSVGKYTSIAINSTDDVHISYHNDTDGNLMHAWSDAGYGDWHITTVDDGGGGADDVGEYNNILINSTDDVHILYRNDTASSLEYEWYDNTAGTWHQETVDSTAVVGQYISASINSTDDIHVSYFDWTNGALKHAWKDTAAGTWTLESLADTVNLPPHSIGAWTALAIDSMNRVHIAYYDNTDKDLLYAGWDGTPPVISNLNILNETTYAAGTVSVNVSVHTDETAECKYATTGGTAFAVMTALTNTNAELHDIVLVVADGIDYDYYIKCNDTSANINPTDYQVSFSVAAAEEEEEESSGSNDGASAIVIAGQAIAEAVPATFGETITAIVGHSASFQVGPSAHSILLVSVEPMSATFELRSNPQNVTVNVGETKQVDLDLDGTPDVKLTLISTDAKKKTAEFSLSEIEGGNLVGYPASDSITLIVVIVIIAAVMAAGFAWFYFRKK